MSESQDIFHRWDFHPKKSFEMEYPEEDWVEQVKENFSFDFEPSPEFKLDEEERESQQTEEIPSQASQEYEPQESQLQNQNTNFLDFISDGQDSEAGSSYQERDDFLDSQIQSEQPILANGSLTNDLKEIFRLVRASNEAAEPAWWGKLSHLEKLKILLCIADKKKPVSSINIETTWAEFRDELCKVSQKKKRKDEEVRNLYISFTSKLLADLTPEYKRDKNHTKLPYLQKILRERGIREDLVRRHVQSCPPDSPAHRERQAARYARHHPDPLAAWPWPRRSGLV